MTPTKRTTRPAKPRKSQTRSVARPRALRAAPVRATQMSATGAESGDVIFFHGPSIVSRLIRLFDGTDWNHCGHVIGPDLLAEIDAGVSVGTKSLAAKLMSYGSKGEAYAGVFRLKTKLDGSLTDTQPVTVSTQAIIAQGPGYGYDAIILLFLLSISKNLPSIPWWGRTLITLLGKRCAALLLDLEHNGKVPLICSAFTHLAYETVATDKDKFAIAVPEFRMAALGKAPTTRLRAVLAPERGSILSEHMKMRAVLSTPGFRRSQLLPADAPALATIEKEGAAFLKRVDGRKPDRKPRSSDVLADNPELVRAIETVLQFYAVAGPKARAAALIGGKDRLISPGDLSVSSSLQKVGRLETDGTFSPI